MQVGLIAASLANRKGLDIYLVGNVKSTEEECGSCDQHPKRANVPRSIRGHLLRRSRISLVRNTV